MDPALLRQAAEELDEPGRPLLDRSVGTPATSQGAGHHEATFEASSLASGVYLYRFEATGATGQFAETSRIVLVK